MSSPDHCSEDKADTKSDNLLSGESTSQDQVHNKADDGEVKGMDEEKPSMPDSSSVYDLEPADDSGFRMGEEISVDPAIVHQLSQGFLQRFLPNLDKSKTSVAEILNNQTVVMETIEQENAKFRDCTAHTQLADMMLKAKNYHNKLLTIKRDMAGLHEKAGKLKKRALKLQQQKQKEELQRAHQQERELEKEQMLTARVASPET